VHGFGQKRKKMDGLLQPNFRQWWIMKVRSPSRTSKQIGAEILQPCYISQLWIPLVYTTLHFLQRKTCVQHKSNYPFFIQHQDYATFFPLEMKYFQFFSSCHSILIRTSVSWNKFQQNPVFFYINLVLIILKTAKQSQK